MRFKKITWIKQFTLRLYRKYFLLPLIKLTASKVQHTPKYKIIKQEFSDRFNNIVFNLKKYNSEEVIFKTARQIALDKELINNLSREDANSISYTAGYEQSALKEPMKGTQSK